MPVNSVHPQYADAEEQWQMCRDAVAGELAVKRAMNRYVPRLTKQADDEYDAYLQRGSFYNAAARTVEGYLGLIFRKEPVFKGPDSGPLGPVFAGFWPDCDLLGTTFRAYCREVTGEVIAIGRAGTLIDWQDVEARAYLMLYKAEEILNWREERIDGRLQLTMVALAECVQAPSSQDPFLRIETQQVRVYSLRQAGGRGQPNQWQWQVQVDIWQLLAREKRKTAEWTLVETKVPLRLGKPLSAIPFVFHGSSNSKPAVEKPPLMDIVSSNFAHWRWSVDFAHGMHFTALPTAWVAGFDSKTELHLGSQQAWVSENPQAHAGYLEFKGEGLQSFERALDRIERHLAVLGSRLLESQKRVSESAEALQIRQSSEHSVISALSASCSSSLTDVLRWVEWWHSSIGSPNEVSDVLVELSSDFETVRMSSNDLTAIVAAWQAGAISQDTMFYQFRQGEILPPGRGFEVEAEAIRKNPPGREILPLRQGAEPQPKQLGLTAKSQRSEEEEGKLGRDARN